MTDLIKTVVVSTPTRPVLPAQSLSDQKLFDVLNYVDEHLLGAAYAARNAIEAAALRWPGEHILFLEDDVIPSTGSGAAIQQLVFLENEGVICLCDMREVPSFSAVGRYQKSALGSDGRGWWGNQALYIHRDVVKYITTQDWFAPFIEQSKAVRAHNVMYEDGGRNCSDMRLALIVHTSRRPLYSVHVPSLFLHKGHDSVCFPGRTMGERETRNWSPVAEATNVLVK